MAEEHTKNVGHRGSERRGFDPIGASRMGNEIAAKEISLRGGGSRPYRKRISQVKSAVDENTERIFGQRTRGQARDASPQHMLSLGPESMKHRVQGIGFRQTVQDLAETILVLDKHGEDGLVNCKPPMDAERAVIPVIPCSSR